MEERYNPKKEVSTFNDKILKLLTSEKIADKNRITEIFTIWNNNILEKGFFKYFVKSTSITNFAELLIKLLENNFSKKKVQGILNHVISLYFEQDIINKDFLILLKKYSFKNLHNYYFKKGLKSDSHTKSVIEVCKENKIFISCANIFRNLWQELYLEEKKYINYITKIDFFKLFYSLNSVIIKNYFDLKILSDIEALLYVDIISLTISDILNQKREIDNKIYTTNSDEIKYDIRLQQLISPPIDKMVEKLLEFYDKKRHFNEFIKDITELELNYTVENEKVHLYPVNEEYFISLKNTDIIKNIYFNIIKSNIRENIDDKFFFVTNLNRETRTNIELHSKQVNFLFGNEVLGMDCHNIINVFYKLAERSIRKYEIDPPATNIKNHAGWGAVNFRTINELSKATLDKIISKRKLTEEEMTKYMDIFSTDINNKDEKINLKTTPFLKYKDMYIWGHVFLAHKNLATLFNNNIILKNIKSKSIIKELSNKFENSVKKIFDEEKIKNISNCIPTDSNIRKFKDIDILAFKDNFLFVIETKLTYDRLNYWNINEHINGALKKGKKQLLERIENIHSYLTENVKKELGIINDNFKIIPLIITSSFEGDFDCGDGISKYSIFELPMVLNSNLEDVYLKKNISKDFCDNILSKITSKYDQYNTSNISKEEFNQTINKFSFKNSLERHKKSINNIEFILDI